MKFISRRIKHNKVGVVDTDTGKESVMTAVEAYNIDSHLEPVAGCQASMGGIIFPVPYQDKSTYNRAQIKARMMGNVRVTCYNDMITAIDWSERDFSSPVTIRLSDFGSKCADHIVMGDIWSEKHCLTIVLDNKCKYTRRSFLQYSKCPMSVMTKAVKFDTRECDFFTALFLFLQLETVMRSDFCHGIIERDWRTIFFSMIDFYRMVLLLPFFICRNLFKNIVYKIRLRKDMKAQAQTP